MIRTSFTADKKKHGFSLEKIQNLKSEGSSAIKFRAAEITSLATAIECVDHAMQTHLAVRSIDSQQGLTAAARSLSNLLNGEGPTE